MHAHAFRQCMMHSDAADDFCRSLTGVYRLIQANCVRVALFGPKRRILTVYRLALRLATRRAASECGS